MYSRMCLHVCIYLYVCINICGYIHVCTYVCIYTYIHIFLFFHETSLDLNYIFQTNFKSFFILRNFSSSFLKIIIAPLSVPSPVLRKF